MKFKKTDECLNCHHQIGESNYCPDCGQVNTEKRLPMRHFFSDFFSDFFTFESKFFRSIFPLVLKPGHLTSQYLDGKRTSYIFPLRLYIFTTFLFFFVVAVNAKFDKEFSEEPEKKDPSELVMQADSLKNLLTQDEVKLSPEQVDDIMDKYKSDWTNTDFSDESGSKMKFDFGDSEDSDNPIIMYLVEKAKYLESLGPAGKSLYFKELINQIPKVMFLLLPIFALLLKLLYIRRKIYYIEHLIFSLHYHTFIFLFLVLSVLISYWWMYTITAVGTLVYLYMSIRKFYGQGKFKSFVKFSMLVFSYTIIMIPAFALLAVLAIVSV